MSTSQKRLGKYELRARLGRGGMAEVWKAFDTQLERYVAIKLMHADLQADPEFMTRFTREARVIASLHHPNIVQIHDFQISRPPESDNPVAYMVMEYIEGQTLADYMRSSSRAGKFPYPVDIVHLFTAISKAIDYAHRRGMIHRDIKPANILLDSRDTAHNPMGEPILTDFGIAKLMGATTGTLSGMWLGTPLYISPEQAQGHPGNERSDIYSLGVILYEMCTGVAPFHGETVPAVMMQHINATPTPPTLINPNIPPALAMVILRCLAKDPAARFSSAAALTAALAEALNVPIPADLSLPGFPADPISGPTVFSPLQPPDRSSPGQGVMPAATSEGGTQLFASYPQSSSPAMIGAASASPSSLGAATTPQLSTPASLSSDSSSIASSLQQAATPPGPSTPATGATQSPLPVMPGVAHGSSPNFLPASRKRRWWLFAGIAVLLLALLGSSLGAFFLLAPHRNGGAGLGSAFAPALAPALVGHVRFISSEQLYVNNNQGLNDQVQIDLQHIAPPADGKRYYAWLLPDAAQSEKAPLFLAALDVHNGEVHVRYPGNAQHDNLLGMFSRFLITEEDARMTPGLPSFDTSAWRYDAEIPPTPNPNDTKSHFSMLDHLRHLLSNDPTIAKVGLQGGLTIWLLRNTEEELTWAVSAKDRWESKNTTSIRQQLINILYYLDGAACIEADIQQVPAGTVTAPQNATIARIGHVSLLETCTQPQAPGYTKHIGLHLLGVTSSPGASPTIRTTASSIEKALNNVQYWLKQMHNDAVQLLAMSDQQLTSNTALALLGDLATQARNAYAGSTDPNTGEWQGGVTWIYSNIQRLATFDVTPHKA